MLSWASAETSTPTALTSKPNALKQNEFKATSTDAEFREFQELGMVGKTIPTLTTEIKMDDQETKYQRVWKAIRKVVFTTSPMPDRYEAEILKTTVFITGYGHWSSTRNTPSATVDLD